VDSIFFEFSEGFSSDLIKKVKIHRPAFDPQTKQHTLSTLTKNQQTKKMMSTIFFHFSTRLSLFQQTTN